MDSTTSTVRDFYEAFPYPSGNPEIRTGSDARFVLSKGALPGLAGRQITVFDAGCGRGVGLIGAASTQPDVQFLGADINRVALEEVRRAVADRELENVEVLELDLMTLDGLEVPEGGFDVIHSSGVVHHLVDPLAGLTRLREVLAPHGVMALMVYGTLGRLAFDRVSALVDTLIGREQPLEERLKIGRAAVLSLAHAGLGDPWDTAARVDDVEFVDRYLNVQQASYTIPELFQLLDSAGLKFADWCVPRDWSLASQLPPELVSIAEQMDVEQQATLIEQVSRPPMLELYVIQKGNMPRQMPDPQDLVNRIFTVSPEGTFHTVRRGLSTQSRLESIAFHRADGIQLPLSSSPLALAGLLLSEQSGPFDGETFVKTLAQEGVSQNDSISVLYEFLRLGVLYSPHLEDLTL